MMILLAGRSFRRVQDLKTGDNGAAALSALHSTFCRRIVAQDNRNTLHFIHSAIFANVHGVPAVSQGKHMTPRLTQREIAKFKVQ